MTPIQIGVWVLALVCGTLLLMWIIDAARTQAPQKEKGKYTHPFDRKKRRKFSKRVSKR